MVFCARYLDLFWNWLSYYNVIMKIIFIISSIAIVYTIRFGVPHKDTYNAEDDAFPYLYLIVPAALLGIAINQDYEATPGDVEPGCSEALDEAGEPRLPPLTVSVFPCRERPVVVYSDAMFRRLSPAHTDLARDARGQPFSRVAFVVFAPGRRPVFCWSSGNR